MKLFAGLRAWYLRRFRGFVAAPARSQGTNWQQHPRWEIGFTCACGRVLAFNSAELVIREKDHAADCAWQFGEDPLKCVCPVSDARYVKICPECRLGHWKDASPQKVRA